MDIRAELRDLMRNKGYTFTAIAKSTGLSRSTVSLWFNNSYTGDNDKVLDKLNNFVQREKERFNDEIVPFVQTSIVKYIFEIGRLCHTKGKIGVCYGEAGLGKTLAVKEYTKHYLDAILIESDPGYTPKSLLLEIHRRLGLSGKGCAYDLMEEVVRKLSNSGRLLIIDEAENLPYKALEATRRIHDKTGIGILLVGMPILVENLRGSQNQYKQLYSRVGYSKSLNRLGADDVNGILTSIKEDVALCPTFLEFSKGNARTLVNLITNSLSVARFNKRQVNSEIIEKTSKLLMV
jgi:DNA transposition AAA+ family ATPase